MGREGHGGKYTQDCQRDGSIFVCSGIEEEEMWEERTCHGGKMLGIHHEERRRDDGENAEKKI